MQIVSLRLENFKSYDDALIEFTAGTNAIVGHNGAGKSSVLEAIGFALFDHTPPGYSQADFVREGARSAIVTVSFLSSMDEREYRVIRRCGSSNQYQIYDPDLDLKVCEGKADVLFFLREHLGVEPDTNLADLFANAVGVPQGLLTSAFLETPARRKPIFDPLLRVEEYKRAYDLLNGPLRTLNQRQSQLDVQISGLAARLERLPLLQESVGALHTSIAAAEKERTTLETQKVLLHEQRQTQELLRTQISDLAAMVRQANQQVQHWTQQTQSAQERLDESVYAQAQVEASRAGHEAFVAAGQAQREIDADVRRRQDLRDQASKRDKQLSLTLAEQAQQQSLLAEIAEAEGVVTSLADAVAQEDRMSASLREAERRAAQFSDLQKQQQRRQKAVADAENRLSALKKQLAQVDSVQQALDVQRSRLDAVAVALVTARDEQSISQAEAERLKTQLAALTEGDGVRCPVCEQPLDDGHRHELQSRNEDQLTRLREAWRVAQQQVKQLDAEQKELQAQTKAHEETLRRLPRAEEGERAAAELAQARHDLAQLNAEIAELSTAPDEVKTLQRELTALDNPRRRQEIAAEKASLRSRTEASLQQIESRIAEQRSALLALQQAIDAFADLDQRIQSVNAELERNRSADDAFRRYEQLASSLAKRRQDADQAAVGLAEAQQMLAEQEASYAEASSRFDEAAYRKLLDEDEQLRLRLGAIDGQLREQRRRLDAEQAEIVHLREREAELVAAQEQHAFLQEQHDLLNLLRGILREAGPYVTAALVKQISFEAAQIFGEIMQDYTRRLQWDEEYAVTLEVDGYKRQFAQLSGGEQMSAALSVRLALLREMSDINVAFFDEPTTNLDETRRESLARQILAIKGFRQLFVISHDDTFEQATENLVRIQKVDGASVVDTGA